MDVILCACYMCKRGKINQRSSFCVVENMCSFGHANQLHGARYRPCIPSLNWFHSVPHQSHQLWDIGCHRFNPLKSMTRQQLDSTGIASKHWPHGVNHWSRVFHEPFIVIWDRAARKFMMLMCIAFRNMYQNRISLTLSLIALTFPFFLLSSRVAVLLILSSWWRILSRCRSVPSRQRALVSRERYRIFLRIRIIAISTHIPQILQGESFRFDKPFALLLVYSHTYRFRKRYTPIMITGEIFLFTLVSVLEQCLLKQTCG